jgi:Replication-relaxation
VPTSLLLRLMPGDQKNNHRHLQTLFHRGLVNRFCLPKYGGPGEFIYYLDSPHSLDTLAAAGLFTAEGPDRRRRQEIIRYNRENNYARLHHDIDSQGKVLYVQHELMISRFHALLELACRKSAATIFLEQWKQGPELWCRVEAPAVREEYGEVEDLGTTELLPHRPDAFFTLYFPGKPEGQQHSHFLYEADRGTENTTRYKRKLRAHWYFTVEQKLQRQLPYNVHSIRAVLTESTGMQWAHNLREAAKHPIVSPHPSQLFWFTTSEVLTNPVQNGSRTIPSYLHQPERIFERIWASPIDDRLLNLAD